MYGREGFLHQENEIHRRFAESVNRLHDAVRYHTSRFDRMRLEEELMYLIRQYRNDLDHLQREFMAYERTERYYQGIHNAYLDILKFSTPQPMYLPKETKVPTEPKKYLVVNMDVTDTSITEDFDTTSFDTLAEAETEAKKLARENKGESYTVFQTYKTFRATEPVEEVVHV